MKKKLLISDIAKQLNVSITTVSFILNGKAKEKRISDDLTERVQKLVEEVGYRPNQLAQSLRTGKTRTIGLMVEDISNPFFANIARLIEERAYQEGYKIVYCSTEDDSDRTKELISMFRDMHVDGYIITPPQGVEEDVEKLIKDGFPVVLVDRQVAGIHTHCVIVDNLSGAYNATAHLMEQGYQNIAFVTTDSRQSQMLQRLEGYRKALAEKQLEPAVLEVPYRYDAKQMLRKIVSFFEETESIDAVLFATNYMAVRGLEAISQFNPQGLPANLGVASYDDHDVFKLLKPTITAVAQPTEAIANHVINLMLHLLNPKNKTSEADTIVLPTQLIIRNSTPRKEVVA
ncbi:LacI family DNA-binding transcriptional regulator [Pontibacter anaerobius]|uniref:LacI family DNA-binding transcriptional regulator n=1 Tax=Pontibacter anaerobius TaxID=2993940 RepID=A0ABT3RES5_9BACT|nr:LacI family DNA-binding transcriptional regulator [Pontibacter anaerobius]MCX2739735.1 LacI family DNA-binding transcriptional regulator [Pontibacter anaerobius]